MTLSLEGYTKHRIGKALIHGGLTHPRRAQLIQCFFYPRTAELCSKIVFQYGIVDTETEQFVEGSTSLRCDSYGDLKLLHDVILRAMVRIGKDQGFLTPETIDAAAHNELQRIKIVFGAY